MKSNLTGLTRFTGYPYFIHIARARGVLKVGRTRESRETSEFLGVADRTGYFMAELPLNSGLNSTFPAKTRFYCKTSGLQELIPNVRGISFAYAGDRKLAGGEL